MENKFLVCVSCMTYNQASYIEKTMNGFCMQETLFPFVCIIMDDASTDGEPEVINRFMDNYFEAEGESKETEHYIQRTGCHKENRNCHFVVFLLKYNHHGKKAKQPYYASFYNNAKYIANCEGDDYWINSNKLQEEVEVLERSEHVTLVHTAFDIVNERGEKIDAPEALYESISRMKKDGFIWQNHLVFGTPILFCTTMYRQGIIDQEGPTIDYAQFMNCARKGKVAYIDQKMSNYRILSTSMMRTARGRVVSRIKDGIFWQLYFFSRRQYETDNYYKRNLRTRVLVSEAIISSLLIWNKLTVPEKNKKLFYILLRPLNLLLLPVALVTKITRRIVTKLNRL